MGLITPNEKKENMKNTVQNTEVLHAPKYCFSYVRFSSEGQRDGSSVERQSPIAAKVASEKGWILKEEWNAQDLAVSAYKGDNIKTIEAIIDSVKSGKIPQSSVMIIEAFDRFSRTDLDTAEDLLKKALKAGLEIYVDRGAHHLTKESINKPIDRIIALLELVAANEYSAKISSRVKESVVIRGGKILNGQVLLKTKENTNRKDCPAWITSNGTAFELNGQAEIIGSMFTMYLAGNGPASIARKFNQENIAGLRGAQWSQQIIYKLLSDRRVIGELVVNGETVKGYYPAAVTADTFSKVTTKLNDNRGKPVTAKADQAIVNLFSGVARCTCGQAIKVTNGNAGKYVTCYGRLKGGNGCKEPMIKYQPFEDGFMHVLRLNPSQLVQDENGDALNANIQILRGRKTEAEKQIANITAMVLKGLASDSLVKTQIALEAQVADFDRQIEVESSKTVAVRGGFERIAEIQANLGNLQTDQGLRMRVQGWTRENINRIDLDRTSKQFTIDLKNGKCITMDFCGNIKGLKSLEALMQFGKPSSVVTLSRTA